MTLDVGEKDPESEKGNMPLGLTVCTRAPDQAAERWKDKPNCESEIKYCVEKRRQKGEWRGGGGGKKKKTKQQKKKTTRLFVKSKCGRNHSLKCGPTSVWPQKMEAQIKKGTAWMGRDQPSGPRRHSQARKKLEEKTLSAKLLLLSRMHSGFQSSGFLSGLL